MDLGGVNVHGCAFLKFYRLHNYNINTWIALEHAKIYKTYFIWHINVKILLGNYLNVYTNLMYLIMCNKMTNILFYIRQITA